MSILIFFHLLGSAVWLGGHLILTIGYLPRALRQRDPAIVQQFETVYEKMGIPALLLQIVTGVWMSIKYLGNLFDAFSFSGMMQSYIAWKLILLLITLVVAVHARFRLITRLKEENLNYLAVHIVTITVLALLLTFLGTGIRVGGW